MNMILNAITAASSGAVRNHSSAATVELELVEVGGRVMFTVIDTGSGPSQEISDRIFEPFVSGSNEGTGLGLSQVKEIADQIGGSVTWCRELDKTKFEFQFGTLAGAN